MNVLLFQTVESNIYFLPFASLQYLRHGNSHQPPSKADDESKFLKSEIRNRGRAKAEPNQTPAHCTNKLDFVFVFRVFVMKASYKCAIIFPVIMGFMHLHSLT